MKKILFVCSFSLLLFSCEKYNQPGIEDNDIPLISKVLIGGEIYTEYVYNNVNLLIEEKSKFRYARHFYNGLNQLIKSDFYWDLSMASSDSRVIEAALNRKEWVNPENTPKSIWHKYEYGNNDQLFRKSFIRASENNSDYLEFQYENDKIVRTTGYYNNIISGYTVYQYYEDGNVSKQTKYTVSSSGVAELTTTTEYEYDNMKNPYQSFRRFMTPGIYTNPNNIVKETYTLNFDVAPSIDKVQITEYSYTYNADGYPVKVNGEKEYVYKLN
jgi:hypothetical protein